jgi:hypothetical protein
MAAGRAQKSACCLRWKAGPKRQSSTTLMEYSDMAMEMTQ